MRPTSRATNRRNILHHIHNNNLYTPINSNAIPKQHIKHPNIILHKHATNKPMNKSITVISLPYRLPSKNTNLWPTPMTTKSQKISPTKTQKSIKDKQTKHLTNLVDAIEQ